MDALQKKRHKESQSKERAKKRFRGANNEYQKAIGEYNSLNKAWERALSKLDFHERRMEQAEKIANNNPSSEKYIKNYIEQEESYNQAKEDYVKTQKALGEKYRELEKLKKRYEGTSEAGE